MDAKLKHQLAKLETQKEKEECIKKYFQSRGFRVETESDSTDSNSAVSKNTIRNPISKQSKDLIVK